MPDVDAVAAMAVLTDALGEPDFPDRYFLTMRLLAKADLCSAFKVEEDGTLSYLFARGDHAGIPGFAERASLDYARRYWQRDLATRQLLQATHPPGRVQVLRQAWNGIRDPEYRRDCYERADVLERLTLYHQGDPRIVAGLYRVRESGPFPLPAVERIEALAPLIMAILAKHLRLVNARQPVPLHPPLRQIADRLLQSGYALSAREAEVSAGLLLGRTHREISERIGLAPSSIVTYRQRAYRKLGVRDQRGLEAIYQGIAQT
ncbi:helix-turn-helix transcriptional regulator [Rhizobium sp. RU36D]|uniref:helix-turn-helix transcriptional regulator n=1 Tax=Rhizobium sp. RU36D TaxID=1907415 RepID=UPI0009D8225B|nr:helix-turn-helix transcriptional regulator [Rhizobium sp. RU36D]SMC87349.1 DNA-binding response regulator, NarL/FixJ family, contains REC and HTH domains [Rhizobium sp. RU36D]